jgi:hypothetical protein
LAVELNPDGSIDPDSLLLTPSIVRVDYRLTYEEVDEMLEEGIGYNEEWELGALLAEANKRRNFRIQNGSTEGIVPNPIPQASVSIFPNETAPDGIGIAISVQVAYNSGKNQSSVVEQLTGSLSPAAPIEDPLSSSYLLVTELMILAGESIGRWKLRVENQARTAGANGDDNNRHSNLVKLAFRTQPKPGKRLQHFQCGALAHFQ